MNSTFDVIDQAAALGLDTPLHTARRFRATVVHATQASHDALLREAVPGLSTADRLRVAVHACRAAGAGELASHYATLLDAEAAPPSPALPQMLDFATLLGSDPRHGDRAAIGVLKAAGLSDAAIVALAQLIAFLAYQTRVVAGLKAINALGAAP